MALNIINPGTVNVASDMYIPASTYRIQANCEFTFRHLEEIIDYLDQLGISTIYCAPFFQSRSKSNHGYDVTNAHVINTELGSLQDFKNIAAGLQKRKMGWLQDIVPNHMAYEHTNVWLRDIFAKGPHSEYWNFFDINWKWKQEPFFEKVILPFLGEELEAALSKNDIRLQYNQQGFFIVYGDADYPASWSSYAQILAYSEDKLSDSNNEALREFRRLRDEFKTLHRQFTEPGIVNNTSQLKEALYELYVSDVNIKKTIDDTLEAIHRDVAAMKQVLDLQYFALQSWHVTDHTINYRRFFIVNQLICMQMERPEVFQYYHQFLKTLLDQQLIQGLRVDHIDGLADPTGYLKALRQLSGDKCYLIVEKILESEEKFPEGWPVQGTSGYEFLATINHLFTKPENEQQFSDIYHAFTGLDDDYEEMVFQKKYHILTTYMNGELDNLVLQMLNIPYIKIESADIARNALAVFMASFNIYRTYTNALPILEEDRVPVEKAFLAAEKRSPELLSEFEVLRSILLVSENDPACEAKLEFLIRFQQFTGPLAAKGVEDTVFYLYNRLISHNEVGDSPKLFGITVHQFHDRMKERLHYTPMSVNATATHDTKRGEDARMRINVLSEIPEAWSTVVHKWKDVNTGIKTGSMETQIPDANDEYFIYQTLIGGFPMEAACDEVFIQRLKDFMMKAMREAKKNSDWNHPNDVYEQGTLAFIDKLLGNEAFMTSFLPFHEIVNHYAMILSLAQTLIKITAPGIPDTYQGTELWDLSFVDPDNRRFIDYDLRKKYLTELLAKNDKSVYLSELMSNAKDGRIKLYTTWAALNERRLRPQIFEQGEYVPLTFSGTKSTHMVGYARRHNDEWSITIAPKEIKQLGAGSKFPIGEIWGDTVVILPANAPAELLNVFTNELYKPASYTLEEKAHESTITIGKKLLLSEVLAYFPIALLRN